MNSKKLSVWNTVIVGFFGGLIVALNQIILYFFNISEIGHRFILRLFSFNGESGRQIIGYLIFIIICCVISIIIAFIYSILLKKIPGWIPGAVYGAVIWAILYFPIPYFLSSKTATQIFEFQTTIATFCLLLLYGIFIGYSISYEYEMNLDS